MKIVFFGTGDFSTTILKGLIDLQQEVVAVVSQTDKVNGRNNKVSFSPIKLFCMQNSIPLFQFAKLNKEGEEVLKNLNPDLFVTASYGQIIKQNILDIPKFGTVNVHGSLLPKYRGATPIQSAILNGEKTTGITIMRTDAGMDTGDIYLSKEINIADEDTSTSVFNKLATLGVECLKEFFDNFDYYINNPIPQNENEATVCHMIKNEDYELNFNSPAINVVNKIRALENCFFMYNNARYKVQLAKVVSMQGRASEILSASPKTGLVVACEKDAVEIITFQPEGKAKMPAKAYMNSGKFKQGDFIN